MATGNRGDEVDVRWFGRWELPAAFAFGRAGGIALHHFRWDLRRFGLGRLDPACHMLSAEPDLLVACAARFGLGATSLQPPEPYRPDIWHFDLYGATLDLLTAAYPPPFDVQDGRRRGGTRALPRPATSQCRGEAVFKDQTGLPCAKEGTGPSPTM